MAARVRASVIINGKVQGVFFRMETKRTADRYGVSGWVKNRRDGAVEATFEGGKDGVSLVIEWCKKGPPLAEVKDTDIEWKDYKGEFSSFKIVY